MKRFITILFTFLTLNVSAQMTLENEYTNVGSFQFLNIEGEGEKYLFIDAAFQKILIYNTNHSLWKTITAPTGYGTISAVYAVSSKLFDLDNSLEMAVSFSGGTPAYHLLIIKENGTIIDTFSNSNYCSLFKVGSAWKIAIPQYNGTSNVKIFSLPGNYTSGILPANHNSDEAATMIYPNPFDNAATIQYSLPSGISQAKLNIYNTSGQLVRTYTVTNHFNDILIQKNELAAGVYTYTLSAPGLKTSQQFIIR